MFLAFFLLLFATAESPLQKGIAALDRKDFSAAVRSLSEASKSAPTDPQIWLLLAQARFAAGDAQGGLSAATSAERYGGKQPEILHGLAYVFAELAHDPGRAAPLEAKFAQLRPLDRDAWKRVASLYLQADQPEQAIQPALTALRSE